MINSTKWIVNFYLIRHILHLSATSSKPDIDSAMKI